MWKFACTLFKAHLYLEHMEQIKISWNIETLEGNSRHPSNRGGSMVVVEHPLTPFCALSFQFQTLFRMYISWLLKRFVCGGSSALPRSIWQPFYSPAPFFLTNPDVTFEWLHFPCSGPYGEASNFVKDWLIWKLGLAFANSERCLGDSGSHYCQTNQTIGNVTKIEEGHWKAYPRNLDGITCQPSPRSRFPFILFPLVNVRLLYSEVQYHSMCVLCVGGCVYTQTSIQLLYWSRLARRNTIQAIRTEGEELIRDENENSCKVPPLVKSQICGLEP